MNPTEILPKIDFPARHYLAERPETNVVMWSWGTQLETATEEDIRLYLEILSRFESSFDGIRFVYMTGPIDPIERFGNLPLALS